MAISRQTGVQLQSLGFPFGMPPFLCNNNKLLFGYLVTLILPDSFQHEPLEWSAY